MRVKIIKRLVTDDVEDFLLLLLLLLDHLVLLVPKLVVDLKPFHKVGPLPMRGVLV